MDFVMIARDPESSVSEACRQFCISRKTGYQWLNRYETGGLAGLTDRSRQPDSEEVPSLAAIGRILRCAGETQTKGRGRPPQYPPTRHETAALWNTRLQPMSCS
jgi:transposase-like protein